MNNRISRALLRQLSAKTLVYWLATGGIILLLMLMFWLLSGPTEESGADLKSRIVASFLPSETQVLLHCPSVPDTVAAFKESHIGSIWRSPEVLDFLEGPVESIPDLKALRDYWERYSQVEAEELLLALGYDGADPVIVAGFQSPLNDDALWATLDPWREWLKTTFDGEWNDTDTGRTRQATFSTNDFELLEVRHKHWYFVSNNSKWLKQVIQRLQGEKVGTILAEQKTYIEMLERLPRDYLTLAYVNVDQPHPPGAPPLPNLSQIPLIDPLQRATAHVSQREMKAMAMTSSIRSGRMVDYARFVTNEAPPISPLSSKTLSFASSSTLAYMGAAIGQEDILTRILGDYIKFWWSDLEQQELFFQGFAQEWAIFVDPIVLESGDDPGVSLSLAFQLKRPEFVWESLKQLVEKEGTEINRERLDIFRLNADRMPPPFSQLFEEVYLSKSRDFLLISTDLEALNKAQSRSGGASELQERPQFKSLARQLPTPDLALGFIDNQRLVERAYEAVQHPLVLGAVWMALRSQTNLVLDFKRLPPMESVVSHLTPTMVVVSRTPSGYQQSSIGSVSPGQWVAGGSLLGALMDQTFFKPLPEQDHVPLLEPFESDAERLLLEDAPLQESGH